MKVDRRILFLLLLALLVRLPGVWWGVRPDGLSHYHPDENRLLRNALSYYRGQRPNDFYPAGYSLQVSAVGFLTRIPVQGLWDFLLIGRLLAVVYGVGTVWLVWRLAAEVGLRGRARAAPALVMALAGVPIVCSHYATADAAVAFWFTATAYFSLCAYRQRAWRPLAMAAFCAGMSLGVKFCLIALIPLLAAALRVRIRWLMPVLAVALATLVAEAATWFHFDWDNLMRLMNEVRTDNFEVVAEHLFVMNPVVYGTQILCGLGLFGTLLVVTGLVGILRQLPRRLDLGQFYCLALPALVHFVGINRMAVPTPRHLLLILPVLALAAGPGWTRLRPHLATVLHNTNLRRSAWFSTRRLCGAAALLTGTASPHPS
jgi:hypothetical protein